MEQDADIKALKRQLAEATAALAALSESEGHYPALYSSFDEGFIEVEVVQEADGRVVDWRYIALNPAFERLTGLQDVTGRLVSEFLPDLEPEWAERYTHAVTTGEAVRFEMPASALGRWFSVYLARIGGSGSRRVVALYRDVTERKRAVLALQESEERQAFLLKVSDAVRPLADPNEVQAVAVRVLGEHFGAVRAQYWEVEPDGEYARSEGGYAKDGPRVTGRVRLNDFGVHVIDAYAAGQTLAVSDVTTDPLVSKEVLAAYAALGVRAYITVPLVKGGRLVALLGVHHTAPRDWTSHEIAMAEETAERTWAAVERARAGAAVRESEEKYRNLFETVPVGFGVIELIRDESGAVADWLVVELNPALERHTGLDRKPLLGQRIMEALPAGFGGELAAMYGDVVESQAPRQTEFFLNGVDRWISVTASPNKGERINLIFEDVTDRTRAEAALRESEERQRILNETLERTVAKRTGERNVLATVVETTDAFIQVADLDFRYLAFNRASADEFERVYGVRPAVGDSMLELLADQPDHQAAVRALWSRALGGEEFTIVEEFGDPKRGRSTYEIRFNTLRDEDGNQVGAYHFVYDVTERLRDQDRLVEAQEALRQSQKLEALGQLTGGVAHDFNNLLTPIIGGLDMLQRRAGLDERGRRIVDGALQSAERAKTLVQRLLAFSRRQPLQPAPVDVAGLIRGLADLVVSTTGPQIKVVVRASSDVAPAMADHNQLEMAILNLAVNARDAMPEGGTLRITAENEVISRAHASELPVGRYVRISVADTGQGMDEQTQRRAFEPFFSTKGIGRGTGLGLSMVHGLVSQLGGALTLNSRIGLGTNVDLWLPASLGPVSETAEHVSPDSSAPHGGSVLLVDDEDIVRESTAQMLEELGYQVVSAPSSEAALLLIEGGSHFDVLVTDHLMPGMSGVELARLVRSRRPGTPVLIVSGYAEATGIAPDLPRLTKPFRQVDLAASLAGAMGL